MKRWLTGEGAGVIKIRLPWRYGLLEPADVVQLTKAGEVCLASVESIQDADDGLDVVLRTLPRGDWAGSAAHRPEPVVVASISLDEPADK